MWVHQLIISIRNVHQTINNILAYKGSVEGLLSMSKFPY